jgi:hypothetical protein
MALPMSRPVKHPKTGIFMLRRRVPDDLRAILGKREEKISLGTRDPDEAKRLHASALSELEDRWARLRVPERSLSHEEVRELTSELAIDYLTAFVGTPPGYTGRNGQRWPVKTSGASPLEWVSGPTAGPDRGPARAATLVDGFLSKSGLRISQQSRDDLIEKVLALLNQLAPSVFFRLEGKFIESPRFGPRLNAYIPQEWLEWKNGAAPAPYLAPTSYGSDRGQEIRATVTSSGPALSELFRSWVKEKSPRQKTVYSWERVTKELATFLGHDDASMISASDLIRWKTALIEKGLAAKTIRDGKLAPIRAILQWACDNHKVEKKCCRARNNRP